MTLMEIELRTLTPLWTGGVDQVCDRVHETGLIGSLRWWYEVLVRSLGGCACDPTSDDRCPDKDGKHCAACELFGCTGWARKFRLRVLDSQGQVIQSPLERNVDFKLQFFEMRTMAGEEKWLLAKAVEIAATYGALGGKTTLKPQRKRRVGDDYGVVEWEKGPNIGQVDVAQYFHSRGWRQVQTKLPDLRWFFFVKGAILWRKQINNLIGLSEDGRYVIGRKGFQEFLRGRRGRGGEPAASKKVFSFRAGGRRVWGYAGNSTMRDEIIEHLRHELGAGNYTIKTGEEVLNEL
jgi:CRISPR-associated protein Cmr1